MADKPVSRALTPIRPSFGVMLAGLLNGRQRDVVWLASACGLTEGEVRALIYGGASPSAAQLEALAAAFGFHTADLFVIAGLPVPEPLQPCELLDGRGVYHLIRTMRLYPADLRAQIREAVDRLPQLPRIREAVPPSWEPNYRRWKGGGFGKTLRPAVLRSPEPNSRQWRGSGFGEVLLILLCVNRNLHSLVTAGEVLDELAGVSLPDLESIGSGKVPLGPIWLAGFASALGIPAVDLAAITGLAFPGMDISAVLPPVDPLAAEMAELLWACRRLSRTQIQQVADKARAMLVEVPEDAAEDDWTIVSVLNVGVCLGVPKR